MVTISPSSGLFTVVGLFAVEPENQARLCDHLARGTEDLIRHLPGFVSASIHSTHDRKHVLTYGQWRTEADFRAMHADPRLRDYFACCRSLARPAQMSCDVTYSSSEQPHVGAST